MSTDAAKDVLAEAFGAREPQDDDLLLLPEFAAMARQSEATMRWLLHRGDLPAPGKIGRRLVWRRSQVNAFIAASFDRRGQTVA